MRNIIVKVADKFEPFYYIVYITTTREAPVKDNDLPREIPEDTNTGSIQCYPTPTKDEINIIVNDINLLMKKPRLKIYNSFAELIYAKIVKSTKEIINVSDLAYGLYFLQISEGKTT